MYYITVVSLLYDLFTAIDRIAVPVVLIMRISRNFIISFTTIELIVQWSDPLNARHNIVDSVSTSVKRTKNRMMKSVLTTLSRFYLYECPHTPISGSHSTGNPGLRKNDLV